MNYNGLAKIIPFRPQASVRVGPPWTTTELGELFRVAHVLRQSGLTIETDMGLSDEGDPWFVFYNVQNEDVLAHFARINGEVVVHGLSAQGVIAGANMQDVIKRLQPVQVLENQRKSQINERISLHPLMILVAFIAASFLASEESHAAQPDSKAEAGSVEKSAAFFTKIKLDWFDRASAILLNKFKDKLDGIEDVSAERKNQHVENGHSSAGLLLLAAAIFHAKNDVSFDGTSMIVDEDTRFATGAGDLSKMIVADVKIAASGVDLEIEAAAGSRASAITTADLSDKTQVVQSTNVESAEISHSPLGTIMEIVNIAPSIAGAGGLVSAQPIVQDMNSFAVPMAFLAHEVILTDAAISVVQPVSKTAMSTDPTIKSATSAAQAAPSNLTASLDISVEKGMLQIHQATVDIRSLEVVVFQKQDVSGMSGAKQTGTETASLGLAEPETTGVNTVSENKNESIPKVITLTQAVENVVVDVGELRIKNFSLGIDKLVIENPDLLTKVPDVSVNAAGDVLLVFNEDTKVILLGIFNPLDLPSGVVTSSAI